MDKSILEVVHDSVRDLDEAGSTKETTLREFDAAVSAARERIDSSADQAHPDEKQSQSGGICRVSEHGKVNGSEMGTGPEKAKWSFIKAAEPGRGKGPGCVDLGKESSC